MTAAPLQIGHKAELTTEGLVLMRELAAWCMLLVCCAALLPCCHVAPLCCLPWRAMSAWFHLHCPPPFALAGDSSQAPGEGAEMGEVALAAAVNLPQIAEQLLAKQGEAATTTDAGSNSSQAAKQALMSGAAVVAAAASALAGGAGQQEGGSGAAAATTTAAVAPGTQDVQSLLEEEINAMNRLLDGRWVPASDCLPLGLCGCFVGWRQQHCRGQHHRRGQPASGRNGRHLARAALAASLCWPSCQDKLLVACSALNEHLEPLYLENLKAAIDKLRADAGQ